MPAGEGLTPPGFPNMYHVFYNGGEGVSKLQTGELMSKQTECLQGIPETVARTSYSKTQAQPEPSQDRLFTDLGPN